MNITVNQIPRARREGLNVQVLETETLVFDTRDDTAHVLNSPAAFVWGLSDGTKSVDEIATAMTAKFGTQADAQVVLYALDQLNKRNLMDGYTRPSAIWHGMTRRQFLARATAGAVLLAVVTSLATPSPAHAQSGCLTENTSCISNPTGCCSGLICCSTGLTCLPALQCLV